jgi:hypothetical protein
MSLANGKPEPRIVLKSGGPYGTTIDDVTLAPSSRFIPKFVPQFLQHEMQDRSLRRKLLGYRFTLELPYEAIQGTDIIKFAKLLNMNTGYDTVLVYPWKTAKPNYYVICTIDDKDLSIENYMLLAHKDWSVTFLSTDLLDYIPLAQADVFLAGDISWMIQDIVGAIEDLD